MRASIQNTSCMIATASSVANVEILRSAITITAVGTWGLGQGRARSSCESVGALVEARRRLDNGFRPKQCSAHGSFAGECMHKIDAYPEKISGISVE
jgi:hypothetical protein